MTALTKHQAWLIRTAITDVREILAFAAVMPKSGRASLTAELAEARGLRRAAMLREIQRAADKRGWTP